MSQAAGAGGGHDMCACSPSSTQPTRLPIAIIGDIVATQLANHPMDCFLLGEAISGGTYTTTTDVECYVGKVPVGSQVMDAGVCGALIGQLAILAELLVLPPRCWSLSPQALTSHNYEKTDGVHLPVLGCRCQTWPHARHPHWEGK